MKVKDEIKSYNSAHVSELSEENEGNHNLNNNKEFQKTARSVGYDSNMRRHPHEKLFAKYNYDIDVIHQAASKDPYLAKYLPQYYKDNSFSYTNIYPGDMMIDYDTNLSTGNVSFQETTKQYNFF